MHDHVRHAHHRVAHEFEELEHGLAAFTEAGKREAEDHRKEDDLKHVALGKGFHRVDRHDVKERIDERRRRHLLGLEAFGREVDPEAGLNDGSENETDRHGDGRRDRIDAEDLRRDAPELGRVGDAGRTGDDGGDHQRNDHHADQTNKERAERLQVCLRKA